MTDKFPSSAAFDAIHEALNASDADRKDAIKQANGVFAFTLKNKAGETESWHIDLKESGKVATGTGKKPTGAFYHILQRPNPNSHVSSSLPLAIRRRLRQARRRKGQCAALVHVWQVEDQGRCDEGDQAGPCAKEGPD